MVNGETPEDAMHVVERLHGPCLWCGVHADWNPEDPAPCISCGETLGKDPFAVDWIPDGHEMLRDRIAKQERRDATLRRIAWAIERLADATEALVEKREARGR